MYTFYSLLKRQGIAKCGGVGVEYTGRGVKNQGGSEGEQTYGQVSGRVDRTALGKWVDVEGINHQQMGKTIIVRRIGTTTVGEREGGQNIEQPWVSGRWVRTTVGECKVGLNNSGRVEKVEQNSLLVSGRVARITLEGGSEQA